MPDEVLDEQDSKPFVPLYSSLFGNPNNPPKERDFLGLVRREGHTRVDNERLENMTQYNRIEDRLQET